MEGALYRFLISSCSVYTHGHHRQFLFLLVDFKKSSPLKLLGQMNENLVEGSMEGPLLRLHISSRSVKKHGRHRQFLFMIG